MFSRKKLPMRRGMSAVNAPTWTSLLRSVGCSSHAHGGAAGRRDYVGARDNLPRPNGVIGVCQRVARATNPELVTAHAACQTLGRRVTGA